MSALKCGVSKCPHGKNARRCTFSAARRSSCEYLLARENIALKRLVRDMIIRFKILGCWCAVEEFSKRAKRLVGK